MPFGVRKSGSKFKVVNETTGSVKGTHSSRSQANRQLRALRANVKDAGSSRKKKKS